jgi:hypothetical protein
MAAPSSQIISAWVQEEITSTEWILLRDLIFIALKKNWAGPSDETLWEQVEEHSTYVAELLRVCVADYQFDGAPSRLEIDNDPSPYVRSVVSTPPDVLKGLRKIDPFKFEEVCAAILNSLGASSNITQKTNDEGVDFVAKSWNAVPHPLAVPSACRAIVIGQAKRYKDGNLINETKLREFVGAGTLRRHRLLQEGQIGPLTPVFFAFWTTSSFDQNAKKYARELGIWYMDGFTLAAYVTLLNLRETVEAMM